MSERGFGLPLDLFSDPRMLELGADDTARLLYVAGRDFSRRKLTDGRIPRAALTTMLGHVPLDTREASAEHLAAVGLWTADGDGWFDEEYGDTNPLMAAVQVKRDRISAIRSELGRRGGLKSAARRKQTAQANGAKQTPKQTASKPQANGSSNEHDPVANASLRESSVERASYGSELSPPIGALPPEGSALGGSDEDDGPLARRRRMARAIREASSPADARRFQGSFRREFGQLYAGEYRPAIHPSVMAIVNRDQPVNPETLAASRRMDMEELRDAG